ncbi:thioredoxin domain-containing protein [Lentzea sp. NPDC034063]|uniref:thioredoxin family protein n=1 Tax=unclassified Lentzea TaxID=2643253 RepID=UPI0033C76BBA
MAVEGTDATFEQEVGQARLLVVVEFYTTWCGNCRRIAPVLDELAAEFAPRVQFVRINVDENPHLVSEFGVTSTPTLFALSDGRQVASAIGAQPTAVLRAVFDAAPSLTVTAPGTGCGCGPSCGSRAPSGTAPSWVPAGACMLPTADQPARLAEFDALFTTSLHEVHRHAPGWLRLSLSADAEDRARDLTAREAECCSFFDFTVGRDGDQVLVDVRVPEDKELVLDGLTTQAEAALAAQV